MFDLHNHLLPGIDDGAPDLDTALALARIAVADGITHMVCTPHIHAGRYDNTADTIAPAFAQLRAALADQRLPLRISHAAEVRITPDLLNPAYTDALPALGSWDGRPVLLLELPHGQVPVGTDKLTQFLLRKGVVPIIAHPERNKGFIARPERLKTLIDQGCLLQLTAGALTGRFGPNAQALAETLLCDGVATLIATDAHNLKSRVPRLYEGLDAAAALIGDAAATALVVDRPQRLSAIHFAQPDTGMLSIGAARALAA